jgi:RNA polymerase sigma-70 factor (ECF subfamily)
VNTSTSHQERADFERLFNDTRTDLLAYLLRRTNTPEDAADLLSQTYLIAWNRLDAVPPDDKARPWLFGVARNLLMKNAERHRAIGHLVQRLATELRTARTEQPPSTQEQLTGIRHALSALSERDQEILLLSAWDGLTPREIAIVVGTSPNTVRVRLHRIRVKLRRQVSGNDEMRSKSVTVSDCELDSDQRFCSNPPRPIPAIHRASSP